MESTHCVNCGKTLMPDFKVCPECGQKVSIHRFTIPHILHELLHAFTHADKGAFHLLKELACRPGVVLQEYIVEGKRKKYFNPFTLLLIVLGFSVFMNSIFHPFQKNQYVTKQQLATAKTAAKKATYQRIVDMQEKVNGFMEKRTNIMTFITAPLMALGFWLVFKGKRLKYAEHLVAYLILNCILSLISTLTFVPLMNIVPQHLIFLLVGGNLVVQIVYTSIAYSKLLQLKGFGEIIMVAGANILGMIFTMTLVMIVTMVYFLLTW
nr:DUF3667 domain-containing protein [uncultured Sediminibacterium sp.]